MVIIQEQIDREAIAVTLKASKLTAKGLAKALRGVGRLIAKAHNSARDAPGRKSMRQFTKHNRDTNTIPIEGDMGLFDKVARKWRVSYAFHKTGPDKYLLLFKAKQADAITACFAEYSSAVMARAKDKRPPVMEQFREAAERAERERPKHKERKRELEVTRE